MCIEASSLHPLILTVGLLCYLLGSDAQLVFNKTTQIKTERIIILVDFCEEEEEHCLT